MAFSLNKVMLIGNLGRDPEIRSTQDGKEIASFSIATTEGWKDRASGERKERTEWHRVVVFALPLVEIVKKYIHKGTKLYIEGTLQTRKWQDQSGAERYTTEVVIQSYNGNIMILDSRKSSEGGDESGHFEAVQIDDEIPF
jgi:single-strand DNA-binding protein